MRLALAKVHFIGIGGIGMCGLAELLRENGRPRFSGSDLAENHNTLRLRARDVNIFIGHEAANVTGADVVVYTSAVRPDNPEFREARRLKIPLIPRAEALAEIMRLKRGIAVGGSHGKTTTTSMTAALFIHAGARPTIVVGGRLELIKSTAQLGQGDWLIAEADESDGSFSRLSPEIVVVTNIDNDHLDYYGSVEQLKKAFVDFAMRIPFYGVAIVCGDDPIARETFKDYGKRILWYGFSEDCDLRLEGEKGEYRVFRRDSKGVSEKLGSVKLQIPGRHNALNAAAAIAAGLEAGFTFETCADGIATFAGVDRRFQHKGLANGVDVYDDYGHHPTEVRAVLSAFKEKFPERRLVTLFQPHRYSRTRLCWSDFVTCFSQTDSLMVCDIYPAGEDPIANVTAERLANEIRASGVSGAEYLAAGDARLSHVLKSLKPGDILLTLGAGDIYKMGMQVLEARSAQ